MMTRTALSLAAMGLLLVCSAAAGAAPGHDAQPFPSNAGLYNAPVETAQPAPPQKVLTLADPELREIVSRFKHPQASAYPSAGLGVIPPGYQPHAFGSVRPYWPPIVIAHPPQPTTPLVITPFTLSPVFAPLLLPGAPLLPFLFMPPVDLIIPGS
jgi:hypothetical protein